MVHKTGRIPKIKPSGSLCYIENKKTKKKKKWSPIIILPIVHQIVETKAWCKYNRSIDAKQQSRNEVFLIRRTEVTNYSNARIIIEKVKFRETSGMRMHSMVFFFLQHILYVYTIIKLLVIFHWLHPEMTIAGTAIVVRQTVKIRRNKDVTQRLCMYTWAERSVMRCSQACVAVYLRTAHPRSIPPRCLLTCSCRTETRSITIHCWRPESRWPETAINPRRFPFPCRVTAVCIPVQ